MEWMSAENEHEASGRNPGSWKVKVTEDTC